MTVTVEGTGGDGSGAKMMVIGVAVLVYCCNMNYKITSQYAEEKATQV